jgi:hypothetical protein
MYSISRPRVCGTGGSGDDDCVITVVLSMLVNVVLVVDVMVRWLKT